MDSNLISRLVKLIGKNNDRIILPDPATGRTVVIMDLEAYEGLLESTDQGDRVANTTPTAVPIAVPTHQEKRHDHAPLDPVIMEPVDSHAVPVAEAVDHAPQPSTSKSAPASVQEIPKKPAFKAKKQKNSQQKSSEDTRSSSDLTQDELLAKINRDIGDWKTAQENRRAEELQSAARIEPGTVSEETYEEARFYLEPIE